MSTLPPKLPVAMRNRVTHDHGRVRMGPLCSMRPQNFPRPQTPSASGTHHQGNPAAVRRAAARPGTCSRSCTDHSSAGSRRPSHSSGCSPPRCPRSRATAGTPRSATTGAVRRSPAAVTAVVTRGRSPSPPHRPRPGLRLRRHPRRPLPLPLLHRRPHQHQHHLRRPRRSRHPRLLPLRRPLRLRPPRPRPRPHRPYAPHPGRWPCPPTADRSGRPRSAIPPWSRSP